EAITYDDRVGAEVTRQRGTHAEFYAVWITQVHSEPGFRLFGPEPDTTVDPACALDRARLSLTVRDAVREEERRWIRCVAGPLASLVTLGAEPADKQAAYVAQAAIQLRDYSISSGSASAFQGSWPFGTLLRGEDTPVALDAPRAIETPD